MEKQELFTRLKDFLQSEPACIKTLACMKKSAQVGIVVGSSLEVCVSHQSGKVQVSEEKPSAPDFTFLATPEAVETLIKEKGLSPGELGVQLVKQVLTQEIQITMPGQFLQVIRHGYLDMLKVGGKEFLAELGKHNLASPTKIMSVLKRLKKRA